MSEVKYTLHVSYMKTKLLCFMLYVKKNGEMLDYLALKITFKR